MTDDRTISSPQQPEAELGATGYCRVCGDCGYGTYDGERTPITNWIAGHRGCNAQSLTPRAAR
ncbi:hypothetical protein [Kitasatospora sp. NPDC093806]|uniref:hypothetical protein n=1 Tax=Kitasatospora sp. NPDC093806 TaxID=3155075 RepID=UPI003429ED44